MKSCLKTLSQIKPNTNNRSHHHQTKLTGRIALTSALYLSLANQCLQHFYTVSPKFPESNELRAVALEGSHVLLLGERFPGTTAGAGPGKQAESGRQAVRAEPGAAEGVSSLQMQPLRGDPELLSFTAITP